LRRHIKIPGQSQRRVRRNTPFAVHDLHPHSEFRIQNFLDNPPPKSYYLVKWLIGLTNFEKPAKRGVLNMANETFLITGAMGCLGSWVIKNLSQQGAQIVAFDLSEDKNRLALVMEPDEYAGVTFVQGDITDTESVKEIVAANGVTHIIHLAALQVPFCKANPPLGAAVNVVGTVNVLEAAKASGIRNTVYASSIAAYGGRDEYESDLLEHDAPLHPHTHYGVYKQANEGNARIYWQDDGMPSIGLRPYTLYGPARDQGLTSSPTKAMLAAARGEPYHISYGGYNGFQFNDDVAKIFIQAARTPFEGADVFNIRGSVAHMDEIVAAIETAEPAAKGTITYEDFEIPFPKGQKDDALRALLGDVPRTPLNDGVAQTIAHFKEAIADGRLPESGEQE
jgi:nucleoside-diphosphate-sugar epimerase